MSPFTLVMAVKLTWHVRVVAMDEACATASAAHASANQVGQELSANIGLARAVTVFRRHVVAADGASGALVNVMA